MKKMLALLIGLGMVLCVSNVFAADAMTENLEKMDGTKNMEKYKLTLACTLDSGGDFELSEALSTSTVNTLHGFYLYSITAYPGATATTDNTDLTIIATEATTNKSVDILGGNGTDLIDATTSKETIPAISFAGLNLYHIMDKENTYTITTANNAEASADPILELIFVQ